MRRRFFEKVSVPPYVLARELDGESILLNLDSGVYYGLDEVGTRMWTVLTESESIGVAYETLLAEYAVEPDELRADLTRLVGELLEQGLLASAAAGSGDDGG